MTCKKIWNKFNMKNVGDYHDHYLKNYVLLLPEVFEKFVDTCLKFYKLDSCHYFSSPGLSWDAMFKMMFKHWHVLIHYIGIKRRNFFTLLKDTVKEITNTWKIIILQNHQYIYFTLIWIICKAVEWVIIFLKVDLSG